MLTTPMFFFFATQKQVMIGIIGAATSLGALATAGTTAKVCVLLAGGVAAVAAAGIAAVVYVYVKRGRPANGEPATNAGAAAGGQPGDAAGGQPGDAAGNRPKDNENRNGLGAFAVVATTVVLTVASLTAMTVVVVPTVCTMVSQCVASTSPSILGGLAASCIGIVSSLFKR